MALKRLFQCFTAWGRPEPQGDPKDAQVIVVQTASDCVDGAPSETNIELATLAGKYHQKLGIPAFPQEEVGKILEAQGIRMVGSVPNQSVLPIFSKGYIGSHGVARLQKDFCDSHGWTRVLILVPYPHAWRALWCYERLGLEVIIPPDLPKMKFQRTMAQRRWRRAITAYPYELTARLWSWCMGHV